MRNSQNIEQPIVDIPVTLEDVFSLQREESVFVAGGTMLQLNWESGQHKPSHLISSHKLDRLKGITEHTLNGENYLRIGSSTLLSECVSDVNIQKKAKIITEACSKIAAPAVRNRGTIGGNVCSRVGDSIPALLVLDAKLEFFNGTSTYIVAMSEWLQESQLAGPPLLLSILIPCEKGWKSRSFFQKIGRRESFTAAIVSTAGYVKLENEIITDIKLAIGGGAHLSQRLADGEAYLLHKEYKNVNWQELRALLETSFQSYSDPFVTDSYRRKAAANIITANILHILKCEKGGEAEDAFN
ncbi:hypothetical protein CEQ21_23080 [Niallia circulans]|uniref:FAD-binding PCMH-type domain-containing protein n=1 Tax=Niallia circulans TaxID=1397 RepID=A0A553SMU4_NIACI|nr:FAD binding domain-containing protein [Niallia circulans]TRZ38287.1 hypothetical protein CEQ21_23080 [Niallia circulans]